MTNGPLDGLDPSQRTQLVSDMIHASVVLFVVTCTTVLALLAHRDLPQDVIGAVFGGAIGYAAGRAGNVRTNNSIIGGKRRDDD